eukprot:jgi/Tetstr1/428194/TSEL_018244.t1
MVLGELLADAHCELQLQRIAEEDVRVALPAPVIGDIFHATISLPRTLQWRAEFIADIRGFRGALATPLEGSEFWTAAATHSTEWLQDAAYALTAASPHLGFKWSSHSLRKDAASAAKSLAATLPTIKQMEGWSKNNEVLAGQYIDTTMRPTPAAWRFFGWLVQAGPRR